jgi:glutamate dehydrogenase
LHETGSGYVAPKFEGKDKQMEEVLDGLEALGFIPPDLMESELHWFYSTRVSMFFSCLRD